MTRLSVVVPTRDRPERLHDCLVSLQCQIVLPHEIVVVDDGSTRDLAPALTGAATARVPVRVVRQEPMGLAAARNTGAEAATGDAVAYLDDDTVAAPRWAGAMARAFEATGCDVVAGRIALAFETARPRWLSAGFCRYLGQFELGDRPDWLAPGIVPNGGNCALTLDAFRQAGGFRTDLGRRGTSLLSNEEVECFRRLRASGARAWYAPEALVHHHVPSERLSADFLCRRAFAQGVSDVLLEEVTPRPAWRRGRELVRAARAVPILARGLTRGSSMGARAWVAYCRGRLAALGGEVTG